MTTNSSTSTASRSHRDLALAVLKAACHATAKLDYAHKFTDNEEDLRACIYHHVRNALDADHRWRVFLSFSTLHAGPDTAWRKPDLVFLRGEPVHTNVSLEILVELKNWPSLDQMQYDLNKLIQLRTRFSNDQPDLVFFGIVGTPFRGHDLQEVEASARAGITEQHGVHVWLYDHDSSYQRPWDHTKQTDPYRQKLRMIEAVANETAA